MGCGKGGPRSGSGFRAYTWHDSPSHAPVWAVLDAHRVIRHICDEDERAWWASRAKQRGGPVEIVSGPALAVLRLGRTWLSASTGWEIFLFLPWLARPFGLPNGHVSAVGSPGRTPVARGWGACSISFWTVHYCRRAGRGFSASWRAVSPACPQINLIIESLCLTLIRALWTSWGDFSGTVTLLYDFFGILAGEGCFVCLFPCSLLLLCGEIGIAWPRGTSDCCLPFCCVAHTALIKIRIPIIMLWYGYLQNCKLPQTRRRRRSILLLAQIKL